MTARGEEERVSLQVEGPGHHKVMAAFEGADPITRIAIAANDAQVTAVKGRHRVQLGGHWGQGSDRAAVMYLLAGPKEEVKRSDDVMRVVAALLESAGPDVVMARLTGGVFGTAAGRRVVAAKAKPARSLATPLPAVSLPELPLDEATRRWAERKEAMLRDNDVVTAVELAGVTGSSAVNKSSRANEWRSNGRIFGVNDGKQWVYPLFQIKEGRPHKLVSEVLRLLRPKMTDWEIFAWFTAPDMWSCQGRKPKDLLDESPKAVVEAARHAVADTWD
jgi:hypothetical protein